MRIPKRIASVVINSLKGGVVPRIGLPYITVGRETEIAALLHDVDIIAEGGASFRFIVGRYGSGKSFLLQTIRNYVMAKNFVVVDADLAYLVFDYHDLRAALAAGDEILRQTQEDARLPRAEKASRRAARSR